MQRRAATRKPGERMMPYGQVPPRGRQDIQCVNCGRKGHPASECRQPRKEKGERPCFTCGKVGHEARNCQDKPAARPVKAVMNSPGAVGGPARPAAVMCVTTRERAVPLGDFIKERGHANHNRYQALTLDVWQGLLNDVTSKLPPPSACFSPISPPSPTSTSLPRISARALKSQQLGETRQICGPSAQGGEVASIVVQKDGPNLQKYSSQVVGSPPTRGRSTAPSACINSYHSHAPSHTFTPIPTHTHTSHISMPTTTTTTATTTTTTTTSASTTTTTTTTTTSTSTTRVR